MNIFVAKLGPETTGEDLRTLFEQFGTVDTAKVIFDHETGNSRGFGFVEMPVEEEGFEAVNALNDTDIQGSRVVIKEARPQGEYQPDGRGDERGGFVPRPGGYDSNRSSGFPGGRGGYDNNRGGGYNNNSGGGFAGNRGGGYNNNSGGGFAGNRGGYDNNRGSGFAGNRGGGYDNNRGGGFGANRGGYDNNRGGGFGGNRGGFDNNRGGGFDRGGYDNNRGNDRGGFDRDRASFGQNRDRFAPERRPQSREDEDLYRFEEFIGNNE